MWTANVLTTVSLLSILAPLVAGLAMFRQLDRPLRILFGMIILAVCTEAASYYLAFNSTSNLWLGQLWTAVEIPCILLVFSFWQSNGRRRILRWAIPGFLLVLVLNKTFLESFDSIDSFSRPMGSALLIAAAMVMFQRILVEPGEGLLRDPRFWVSSAVLIYHAGNLTLFTLGMLLLKEAPDTFAAFYSVHSVINTLGNLLYATGFLCRPRR